MDITVKEAVPGLEGAKQVQSTIRKAGIQDVELFFDREIRMWAVCQVQKNRGNFILPSSYNEGGVKPYILWWCKNNEGRFRAPNDQDALDILKIVQRAPAIWEKGGDARADKFDAQDKARDEEHNRKQSERIKEVAPRLKKAIRKELG